MAMLRLLTSLTVLCAATFSQGAEIRVPALTAYLLPDPDGARVSERDGVTKWRDPALSVNWYGRFARAGELSVKVEMRLPREQESRFRLTVSGQSREVTVRGTDELVVADFGTFTLSESGYQRIALESLSVSGQPIADVKTLVLSGSATDEAHFNLKERRNAASVHLMYPVPKETPVTAFYCEVTATEDPTATFYMACGWHRGYFGMQVNSPTERRIIFSVWDSGDEAVDRGKVSTENRVQLVDQGDGVFTGDFGNEGTGGHSHLKYGWKTGETQKFLVTAQPVDATHTVFAGYYFHPEKKTWMLISAWNAPNEGGWLRHLHSFSENFWGSNGHVVRKALYGNQWMRTMDGKWHELTTASFSHDGTGKADRLDRFMGVEGNQFFLSHGGYIEGSTSYGEKFTRPATGIEPSGLPALPVAPYPDGRSRAVLRLDAQDQGVVLAYGDGPNECDKLGAREAILFESEGTYYLHYDGAGPRGWLACLATSTDLSHWTKRGPILELGAAGEPDSACACSPWVYFDGHAWHMFYVATNLATPAPDFVPAVPYLTCKAKSVGPGGPWVKQKDVVPFRPRPGSYYSDTASAGDVVKNGEEYLMYFAAATGPPFRRTLGIARTRDLDGAWQVDPEPMVPLDEQIENSSLYFESTNQTWFLFTNHVGLDARGEYTDAIWVYWSKDLNHWDPRHKAVVLDGRNCSWSTDCIGMPTVRRVGERLVLLYDAPGGTSVDHMRRSIGLAWLPLPLNPPGITPK